MKNHIILFIVLIFLTSDRLYASDHADPIVLKKY